jgi:RNA polymerase sigma factor (sigma-70 family)
MGGKCPTLNHHLRNDAPSDEEFCRIYHHGGSLLVKDIMDSQELLREYAENDSELAFRELVARYTDLVYSTAGRLVGNDSHLAQDVAQTVFLDLARMARTFSRKVMLGGWLHRHTCFVAKKALRTELRRQSRERQAAQMNALNEYKAGLGEAGDALDEAINQLSEQDRTAIILRFFEQRDFRGVGQALGTSEDTAQKRVSRALEKLHWLLGRKGIALSAGALAVALAGGAVTAAPAGMAASLAATALSGAASSTISLSILKMAIMTKIKLGLLGALALGAIASHLVIQRQAQVRLRAKEEQLQQANDQLVQALAENQRLSNLLAKGRPGMSQSQMDELLRLRGQVGVLKRELAEAPKSLKAPAPALDAQNDSQDQQQQLAMAKLNYPKYWMLAFQLYAAQHDGQCPTNFEQAAAFLPEEFTNRTDLVPDQFQIAYQGAFNAITNPQSIIVIREKQAWQAADGGWLRAYGFADGHTELHKAANGDFGPWEAQHLLVPSNP